MDLYFSLFHMFSLFYVYESFAFIFVCVPCARLVPTKVRREHQCPQKLELQMVARPHVSAGNQTVVLRMDKCS